MPFTAIGVTISTSASLSALAQSTNAIRVGGTGLSPDLHIVTCKFGGTNTGGKIYALLGASASVTASTHGGVGWSTIADSTIDAATPTVNLWVPNDCYLGFDMVAASAGTYVTLQVADSQQGGG